MKQKQLFLTTAMAATLGALGGCASEDDWSNEQYAEYATAVCVDQDGRRIPDRSCDDDYHAGGSYRWYYVNRGGRIPYYGDSINDRTLGFTGSTTADVSKIYSRAPGTTAMTRSAAVARGGFGSHGFHFGGGRS